MKFPGLNLSGLAGPEILSAEVELRDIVCQADPMIVYCYQFAGYDWEESTATWNNVSPNSLTNYLSSNTVSYSNGLNQVVHHRYKFSILTAVRSWTMSSDSQSKGIQFKTSSTIENGTNYITKVFASFNRDNYKPSLTVTTASRNITSWDIITARGEIVTGTNKHYTFKPSVSGTYHIKTEQYLGAPSRDTKLYLFDTSNVAYGLPPNNGSPQSGSISHFSRIEGGITRAKLDDKELVRHNSYTAYITNGRYGIPKAFYVKNI